MNIYGTIKDANTGETLPYANVYFSDKLGNYTAGNTGITSDLDGNFSITGTGKYLTASYTGYTAKTIRATQGRHDFALSAGIDLPEVVIKGKILWPRVLAGVILLIMAFYLYRKLKK